MEIPGFFQVIAEIGIAIAGFSGLIVSLRRETGPLRGVQKFRLQLLLLLSFGAMFLSLLPEVLVTLGVGAERLWFFSNWVVLGYSVFFISWWITASIRVNRIEPELFNWFAFARMSAGHLVVIFLLLFALGSLFGISGIAAFSIALVWYLIHAAQQFIRMLFIRSRSDLG